MASIVVSGSVLRRPLGGNLATHLHYLIGLRKLGHDVLYLEQADGPETEGTSPVPRTGLVLMRDLLRRCRVEVPVVWVDPDAGLVGGMVWPQLRRRLASADLLLDLGGHCWLPERELAARRALVELEPGARGPELQSDHDVYFSLRRDLDADGEPEWNPTLPPIVPRLWYGPPADARLPVLVIAGTRFREGLAPGWPLDALLELPRRVRAPLWIVLPTRDAEIGARLAQAGWTVRDRATLEASLSSYRAHVVGSQAAISFLEGSGGGGVGIWLSAHSACFMAAGRPVLVDESGEGSWLPRGGGVLGVADADAAVEALERVRSHLPRHSREARAVAAQVCHYRVVLPRLLERALPRALEAVA